MAIYIEMPKLSDTMTEGTLVKWRKQLGDRVEVGDIIAEIETDKATMEMEAFDEGILTKTYVNPGDTIAIGQRMGLLLAEGEQPPPDAEQAPPPPSAKRKPAAAQPEKQSAPPPASTPPATKTAAAEPGQRVKASPLARKLAAAKNIDLTTLSGSGPGGRVVAADVEAAAGVRPVQRPGVPQAAAAAPVVPAIPVTPPGEGDERISLTGMRRVIAERLLASKTQIPHFYLNGDVDVGELLRLRAEVNAVAEKAGEPKITINDFVLKATAIAAMRVPKVNAAYAGDAVIQYGRVHLAVAVAVDDGLVTPVVRDASEKTIRQISAEVKELASRARNKKLKPEEYQGGTLTVSNLGAFGVESFLAIINPPQALILSVGAVSKKPVVDSEGRIVVGDRMNIGLSCDHRVVDGAVASQFFSELKQLIENPALMLV